MVNEVLRTELPDEWEALSLGEHSQIFRGGSPRPIQEFLTTSDTGVNWIKIGDVDADAKYITATEEKIIPEGVSRSRMVYEGDLILSNSMSYGRPYIMNIQGCIHDGWLVIQKYDKAFDKALMAIYDNTGEDEKLALKIHKAVKKQALSGFRENQVVIRRIKKALFEIIGDDSEVERIYKIIEKQEEY